MRSTRPASAGASSGMCKPCLRPQHLLKISLRVLKVIYLRSTAYRKLKEVGVVAGTSMKTIRRVTTPQLAVTALLPALVAILSLLPAILDLETDRDILPVTLVAPVVTAFVISLLLPSANYKYRPILAALPLPFL